ncbi:uncharacterized protein LOC135673408 [Musa acuminata AAA Group]|uniref:(wild Malaysian banana) hypothetical protein n=1 Tax=Musa acuminata subsp. malaccensis TaxID=214687 RepID=A0A804J2L7_MUSAM|nr:PREDICTED: uncharacterized protein LOC103984712 [Musa acuminata subsp. malaccensis]CAG1837983.1 unnamed protein product [Musa acuminata subsp. malaccensis]
MDDFRSRSFNDGKMQLEVYGGRRSGAVPAPPVLHDYRSYSASYFYTYDGSGVGYGDFKGKPDHGSSASNKGGRVFKDPEFQRKRRVASYKAYAVEGKVKGSLRRSLRWFKDKYTRAVYGWW